MEFVLPIKGESVALPTDKEAQGTSGHLSNVRPTDIFERKIRIGQRPGLKKLYSEQIGGAVAPIVALLSVTVID